MKKINFRKGFKLMKWLREENYALPECYDIDRIILLVRDPRWLYTYWDLSEETQKKAQASLANLALRVYDVSDIIFDGNNAHCCWDIFIHTFTDNWYIPIPNNGRSYLVELGYYEQNNCFVSLLRSNPILTPPDKMAATFNRQLCWLLGRETYTLYGLSDDDFIEEEIMLAKEMTGAGSWDEPSTYTSGSLQGHWG